MEEHLCTNCGASLPPTGTYCLACDTPVENAAKGLSVGDIQVVQKGRPIVMVGISLAVVLVVGGIVYGVHSFMAHRADGEAGNAAKKGVEIVVRAESGHSGACPYVSEVFMGDPKTEEKACLALVGDDPGAHLKHLRAASVHRSGSHGSVDLEGTLVDKSGKRTFEKDLTLQKQSSGWMIDWDGSAYAAS